MPDEAIIRGRTHTPIADLMGAARVLSGGQTMDESKRSFIKQSLGLIAASGVVAGGLQHADALEPPEVPTSMKVPGAGMSEYVAPPSTKAR
jgi:hypothetical protein